MNKNKLIGNILMAIFVVALGYSTSFVASLLSESIGVMLAKIMLFLVYIVCVCSIFIMWSDFERNMRECRSNTDNKEDIA